MERIVQNIREDLGKLRPFYIADGNIEWSSDFQNQYNSFLLKSRHRLSIQPNITLLRSAVENLIITHRPTCECLQQHYTHSQ